MSVAGFEVPPLSREVIRKTANQLREFLHWEQPYFPIVEVVELALPELYQGFIFDVATADEIGDDHGQTYPDKKLIRIREDVYERACEGHGRDRATIAHELGHLILHTDIPLARSAATASIPAFRNSEWQANCFAGELLVCYQHIEGCQTVADIVARFGVSSQAADYQMKAFRKDGLLK